MAQTPLIAQASADPAMTSLLAVEGAIVAGAVLFGAISGIAALRARKRAVTIQMEADMALRRMAEKLERQDALSRFEDKIIMVWEGGSGNSPSTVTGQMPRIADLPRQLALAADFAGWLEAESAAELELLVAELRARGTNFEAVVRTRSGDLLDAEGRCTATAAILRLRDMTPQRLELAKIANRHASLLRDLDALRGLLAHMPHPAFIWDKSGGMPWANDAFAQVMGLANADEAVDRQTRFFDDKTRKEIETALKTAKTWRKRVKIETPAGKRSFDAAVVQTARGSAVIATDAGEIEQVKRDLKRLTSSHQDTIDNLTVPVSVYDADQRLAYYNAAWRDMWELSDEFLADKPDLGAILDRLRQHHKLPEEANFKAWRAEQLAGFSADKKPATRAGDDNRPPYWHLPNGRTLKIHTHRNPMGGLTIVQEDVSDALNLQSRFEASKRMSQDTLNALSDAVIVFGSDGRWLLSNPAFEQLWRIPAGKIPSAMPSETRARPHIDDILQWSRATADDAAPWGKVAQSVFAMGEQRRAVSERLARHDGSVIDAAALPMAEGATLITFVDVTAQANVEKALTERNEALEAADHIKNNFVHHISYELRSPLTNIIGFAQLLADTKIGELNEKQHEYTGYIMNSSASLLAIINDILDLATIDAGGVVLDLARIDVRETVLAAVDGVRDRLGVDHITLEIDIPQDVGSFIADAKRIRQILYNLLSNAIGFSEAGQRVRLSARREGDVLAFKVEDKGRGIPAEQLARVFDRFESQTRGSRHRGVGLGLAIVKSFVDLHKGCVQITSAQGEGTSVSIWLPENPQTSRKLSLPTDASPPAQLGHDAHKEQPAGS